MAIETAASSDALFAERIYIFNYVALVESTRKRRCLSYKETGAVGLSMGVVAPPAVKSSASRGQIFHFGCVESGLPPTQVGLFRYLVYNLFNPQDHTFQKSLDGAIGQKISGASKSWALLQACSLSSPTKPAHTEEFCRSIRWAALVATIEAGEYDDVMGEWLGVPMFISSFDPESVKQMVDEAGFELLETAIESQAEQGNYVPYLWLFGRKR